MAALNLSNYERLVGYDEVSARIGSKRSALECPADLVWHRIGLNIAFQVHIGVLLDVVPFQCCAQVNCKLRHIYWERKWERPSERQWERETLDIIGRCTGNTLSTVIFGWLILPLKDFKKIWQFIWQFLYTLLSIYLRPLDRLSIIDSRPRNDYYYGNSIILSSRKE